MRQHPPLLRGEGTGRGTDVKILHLVKRELAPTEKAILEAHRGAGEVTVIDLRTDRDYSRIVDQIAASDKIISW
jgi:hypothetical protein